jgi:hypothetical protein
LEVRKFQIEVLEIAPKAMKAILPYLSKYHAPSNKTCISISVTSRKDYLNETNTKDQKVISHIKVPV